MSTKNRNRVEPGNEVKKKRINLKRSRKNAFVNADYLNKCNVPLSNKFDPLSEDDDNNVEMTGKEQEKKEKIAPIVVTKPNVDIQSIANTMKVECDIKIMSIGRKVFVKSLEHKSLLMETFKTNNIDFFTYPDDTNKIFKIILKGLPVIETSLIIDELKTKHELTPTKVTMFNTKSPNKLYLCEFNKSDIHNKKLNTIQAIHQHIIKWQPYIPKRKGPTQCQRCLAYGHGIRMCNRFTVCALCAGTHLTNQCTVITEHTKNPVYKCFNCASNDLQHNHKATDPTCIFRTKYTTTMSSVREKNKRSSKKNTNTNNTQATHGIVDAPAPAPLTSTYAQTTVTRSDNQSNTTTSSSNTSASNSNFNTHSNANTNSNLWTLAQVTQLLFSSINQLKQCKTKMDQLVVITNLLQHACE